MFRPLRLFSKAADPIFCPAALDGQPCIIPQCFFSHEVYLPQPPPAPPPPSKPITAPAPAPTPTEPEDSYEPPPAITPPKKTVDPRLRDIVEGKKITEAKKTQDLVAARDKRPRSVEVQCGAAKDVKDAINSATKGASKAVETGNVSPGASSVIASSDAWPTPAQSSKKLKTSKAGGSDVPVDEFYGNHVPSNTTAVSNKAGTVKSTTATSGRPPKRPAPDSPTLSTVTKADPLKRPKTTTAMSLTAKSFDSTKTSKPVVRQTLNPRLIQRSPAPHGQRLQYLQILQTELTRLSGNPKGDAATQAIICKCLDLEEDIALKKREIYRQAMGKLCMRYKKATMEDYKKELDEERVKATPAPVVSPTSKAGLENAKLPLDTGLPKPTELTRLRDFVVGVETLKKHSYILTPPTAAEIEQARAGVEAAGGYETCERCTQRFQVFPGRRISDGALTTGGTCTYHHGRKAGPRSTPGTISEAKWTCCGGVVGFHNGCETAPTHVFKVTDPKRLALQLPFSKTPPNPNIKTERALALDCEMSYTTHGMELTRITATAFPSGKIVIDALVKPYGVVLDFNTRFSGVSSEMLTSASPWRPTAPYPDVSSTELINPTTHSPPEKLGIFASPSQARKALYHYIGPNTILIGHALENDLLHLRMCHEAIVDTAVLFPHNRGLPMRNKLKYIVQHFLGREIQVDGGDSGLKGHDSAIDARCAAELCRYRIKEAEEKQKV